MSAYTEAYNFRVRRINALVRAQENLEFENTLDGLGGKKKKKLTKAEKQEKKRLAKLEKQERLELHKLTSKKERERIAKRAKKAGKKFRKGLKKGTATGFVAELNSPTIQFPLSEQAEALRQASITGDFITMNQIAPFGPQALTWSKNTPLGKFRFQTQNGQPIWFPWSEQDIINFLNGPWLVRDPQTGLAPLLHPRRKIAFDKGAKIKKFVKRAEKAASKFPNTDPRHTSSINAGEYTYKHGLDSTWTKIRAPVMIAIAIVASVYCGPAILQAVQAGLAKAGAALGIGGGATGGAAGAAGATAAGTGTAATAGTVTAKATFASKVFAGAKTLSGYVNNARTAKAIIKGDEIPPPVGVSGENFGEWAFKVAKDEAFKEYGRRLTEKEEKEMRAEIRKMQNELAPYVKDVPFEQPQDLPPAIKKIQDIEVVKEEKRQQMLQLAIPAAIGLLVLKGVA